YLACQEGHDACVRALLDTGANVEAVAKNGRTPLRAARSSGHAACVRALLYAGAHRGAAMQPDFDRVASTACAWF
ncbi:ankyrin repeat domain-containing protein, partial [archaeon]